MQLDDAISFVGGDYGPTPHMAANICFRFVLNLGASLACWVPLSLFYKNKEFAGVAMVVATAIMNFYYGVNAVIWPTNHVEAWFTGHGWCDIQLALWSPLETINAAAICAVMHNIANQVSLMRASDLTVQEKRRKHLIQALVIFPIPALQLVLYYFTIGMRYNISGILGCQAVFQANWIFLVFFLLPCPIFALAAAYFAALTWWRYRQIDASSRRALYNSGCYGAAQARSARVRRKLYWMALTIVVPYCPMQLIFLFNNLRMGWPWARTYDLGQLHAPGWATIDYAPSTTVPFVSMYINYIVFLEVVVFFIYFGCTKDAHEMYRRYLRALGLGRIFPGLNEQWQPSDRPPTTIKDLWPRAKSFSSSFIPSVYTDSRASSTYKAPTRPTEQSFNHVDHPDDDNFLNIRVDSLDLERATATLDAARSSNRGPQLPYPGPGVFRINIAPRFQPPQPRTRSLTTRARAQKMPRPTVSHPEADSPPVCPSSSSSVAPILPPLHLSPTFPSQSKLVPILSPGNPSPERSPILGQDGSLNKSDLPQLEKRSLVKAERDDGWGMGSRTRRSTVEKPRLQIPHEQGPPTETITPRLSDYGRCLVSIRRDFSSSAKKSDPRSRPQ